MCTSSGQTISFDNSQAARFNLGDAKFVAKYIIQDYRASVAISLIIIILFLNYLMTIEYFLKSIYKEKKA